MTSAITFLQSITYWYWLAFGLFLIIVELLAPGVFFLWLGVAAVATGLALAAFPTMVWEAQFIAFALLSVVSVLVGRRVVFAREAATDHPTLNRRGDHLVGQIFRLAEATVEGQGRLHVGDSMWAVSVAPQGVDLAAGARVRVTGVDGATLTVEDAS